MQPIFVQDESQIKHALKQYKAATTGDRNTSGAPSVESIQELLNVARTVGNVRPKNLIKALQGCVLYSIYKYIYIYLYIYLYMCVCVCVCVCARARACVCAC